MFFLLFYSHWNIIYSFTKEGNHDSTLIIVFLIYVRIKFYWIRKILAEKNENGLVWKK